METRYEWVIQFESSPNAGNTTRRLIAATFNDAVTLFNENLNPTNTAVVLSVVRGPEVLVVV